MVKKMNVPVLIKCPVILKVMVEFSVGRRRKAASP